MVKVRLIVITAFQSNLTPVQPFLIFKSTNCLLKAHNLEVLLGGDSYLPLEQVNEMFLGVPNLFTQLAQTQ